MRLICPNCGAQYEVPDNVIPSDGRDVQCSNCGITWFFDPNAQEPEIDAVVETEPEIAAPTQDPAPEAAPKPETGAQPEQTEAQDDGLDINLDDIDIPEVALPAEDVVKEDAPVAAVSVPSRESRPWDNDRPVDVVIEEEDVAAAKAALKDATPRAALKQDVADILRAEVEHETAVRAAEGSVLETQTDLGLDDQERRAPLTAPQSDADIATQQAPQKPSRRDLLPDIEEINSTLTATNTRKSNVMVSDEEAQVRAAKKRRGSRLGFGLVLFLFGAVIGAYLNADKLIELAPQFEPQIIQFVDQVNLGRIWLDATANTLLEQLKALAE